MSSEQSFMEAILQSPDDDALRLIFADWLEERGDPRGEFIRVQYALMQYDYSWTDEHFDERKWLELKKRELQLIAEHGPKWAGPIHDVAHRYTFKLGVVDYVHLDVETFRRKAKRLFALYPIRWVSLWKYTPDLFTCPLLARIDGLQLDGNSLTDLDMHLLAECPHLKHLRQLALRFNQIGPDGARALASSTVLSSLEELCVGWNPIEDLGFQAVCASRNLGRLTNLDVSECSLGIDGLRGAAKDFRLSRVKELDLSRNEPLDRRALAMLAQIPFGGSLRTLNIDNASLGSVAIRPLPESPTFASLSQLDLSCNHLTDTAAKYLADSPHLSNLQRLNLYANNFSAAGRKMLKARFGTAVTFEENRFVALWRSHNLVEP